MRLRRRSAEDLKNEIKDTFLAASAEEAGALACEGGGHWTHMRHAPPLNMFTSGESQSGYGEST